MNLFRRALSLLAVPFFVVISLNIQELAALTGWDQVLARWFPAMYDFLTQPWVYALSAFVVGIAGGIWLHYFAIKIDRSGNRRFVASRTSFTLKEAARLLAGDHPNGGALSHSAEAKLYQLKKSVISHEVSPQNIGRVIRSLKSAYGFDGTWSDNLHEVIIDIESDTSLNLAEISRHDLKSIAKSDGISIPGL